QNWIDNGFGEPGQNVTISGLGPNNGTYVITSVSGSVMVLGLGPDIEATRFVNVSLTFTNTSGVVRVQRNDGRGWDDDGFGAGTVFVVSGAGANNGTYTITAL